MSERPGRTTAELSILADAGQVRRASAWLKQTGDEYGVPIEQIWRLDLCLNEALANVVAHGSGTGSVPVGLRMNVGRHLDQREASVTMTDNGPSFDTTSAEMKVRPTSLAEAEPGGLGLMMIRSFSDALAYRYLEGRNELTFTVRWSER